MFNLQKKLREQREASASGASAADRTANKTGRISVRDLLLTQEFNDKSKNVPNVFRIRRRLKLATESSAEGRFSMVISEYKIQDVTKNLPEGCEVIFPDPNSLHEIQIKISPRSGFWMGGHFTFHVSVPLEYNIMPPKATCDTKVWHPNIDENGQVCLSILRSTSLDGSGWAPTRTLKDVIWGLHALFFDLLNFDDPLNVQAAEHYRTNKDSFLRKVKDYIYLYAK